MLSQTQIRYYWSPRCSGPWAAVSLYGAGRVTVDAAAVSAVKALDQVLRAYSYETRAADTGAYNCRMNTSGTGWSIHAYGIAIDINWQSNPYSRYLRTDMLRNGDGRMPHRICAIRTNNGRQIWNWGGFWSGNKDAMHYEVVCTPADLRTGVNWSTVYGGGGYTLPAPAPKPVPAPPPHLRNSNMLIYNVTDQGKFFAVMPDGLVRMTPQEAYLVAMGNAQTVSVVKVSTDFFNKLHSGPRAVSFNNAPPMEP